MCDYSTCDECDWFDDRNWLCKINSIWEPVDPEQPVCSAFKWKDESAAVHSHNSNG